MSELITLDNQNDFPHNSNRILDDNSMDYSKVLLTLFDVHKKGRRVNLKDLIVIYKSV